jgi:hypothetical protein
MDEIIGNIVLAGPGFSLIICHFHFNEDIDIDKPLNTFNGLLSIIRIEKGSN